MSEREKWLKGYERMRNGVTVGPTSHCAGCGQVFVRTADPVEGYPPPESLPDWPFPEDDCPVHAKLFEWAAQSRSMSYWISVKDRLPEDRTEVLIFANISTMLVCVYVYGEWYEDIDEAPIEGVTHWMPLPEPPNAR